MTAPRRLLLIRRDNIGDLVCTTPLFRSLRDRFSEAFIAAYVNGYSLPVLQGNTDLDLVHAYTKAKHRAQGTAVLPLYWRRFRQMLALRAERFDDIIIAEPVYSARLVRLARFLAPRRVIGFAGERANATGLDVAVARNTAHPLHEVEDIYRLLGTYGIAGTPPALRVVAGRAHVVARAAQRIVALHISARKPSQRWSEASCIALARQLTSRGDTAVRLFWSPGDAANRLHPGDDSKAGAVLAQLGDLPVQGVATHDLRTLIDELAACDAVVCSDGGAMHIAAGLGKPIVCLFGDSDAARWHPWGVRYELLQKPSLNVADIAVEEVLAAFDRISA